MQVLRNFIEQNTIVPSYDIAGTSENIGTPSTTVNLGLHKLGLRTNLSLTSESYW